MTGGTTVAYPRPSQKALLTEIRHRLHLVLGRNIRSSLPEPSCTNRSTLIITDHQQSQYLDRLALIPTTLEKIVNDLDDPLTDYTDLKQLQHVNINRI